MLLGVFSQIYPNSMESRLAPTLHAVPIESRSNSKKIYCFVPHLQQKYESEKYPAEQIQALRKLADSVRETIRMAPSWRPDSDDIMRRAASASGWWQKKERPGVVLFLCVFVLGSPPGRRALRQLALPPEVPH